MHVVAQRLAALRKDFVVFAGSGAVADSHVPTWKGLMKRLLDVQPLKDFAPAQLDELPETEYPWLASRIRQEMIRNGRGGEWYRIIDDALTSKVSPCTINQAEIVQTCTNIVTTNVDDGFEYALQRHAGLAKKDICINTMPNLPLRDCFNRPTVVYLHGNTDVQHIIFTKEEYDRYYPSVSTSQCSSPHLEDFLKYLYTSHTLVFVGFSFLDNYVVQSFKNIAEKARRDDAFEQGTTH